MFLSKLILEADPRPDWWRVHAPLVWSCATFGQIVVPVGFQTDLASIPRMLRDWEDFDPCGISRRPAVLHDWCYSKASKRPKHEADQLFRMALKAEGMSDTAAFAHYAAVDKFGSSSYNAR